MRLNDGMPVWHASVSAQTPRGFVHAPGLIERWAIRLLRGVGGQREWWIYNPLAHVGHPRVGLTPEEAALLPAGVAVSDAGESGPERGRTP